MPTCTIDTVSSLQLEAQPSPVDSDAASRSAVETLLRAIGARGGPPADRDGGDHDGDAHRNPHREGLPLGVVGMWVALVPIAMLFLSFVVTYAARHDFRHDWTPHALPGILWANTAVLLASGAVLERARALEQQRRQARPWILAALGCGLLFLLGQVVAWQEWRDRGVGIATSPHSTFFYVLTAAHALHLAGGLAGLAAAACWPTAGWLGSSLGVALRVNAIYWHFLAALWCALLVVLQTLR